MAFIRYITKSNGYEYASLADSTREGNQVTQGYIGNLGRVVDKELGIFKSRERGLFRYTEKEGFCELPDSYLQKYEKNRVEKLILDFGDSFFLHQYLEKQTIKDAYYQLLTTQTDTLMSLVFYRILTDKKAYCYADTWWQGSYASILFPSAKLESQRVSEFLAYIGQEEVLRTFFREYFRLLYGGEDTTGILIDSTGLPNASNMSITQISNHNGDINEEARLIYVIDRQTGMPIYFRYCAGNIIDVTTLCTTLAELRQYHIAIDYAIVDAGYCSEQNIEELYNNHVRFVTRLAPNRTLFKEVTAIHLSGLMTSSNALRYGNRLLYMKKVSINLYGYTGYAYIGIDVDSRNQQMKKVTFTAMDDKLSPEAIDRRISSLGLFMIISSEDIEISEILPLYYTRQQVEQVFDLGKNNADLLPIRVHNEDTFRGHLMITFLATAILQALQRDIITKRKKKDKINPEGSFMILRNQKCKVFTDEIVPQEAVKGINDIYHLLDIKCPHSISRSL